MMAAILNSAILDSANLHKKIHLFILTQLDNGSHLEICHLGFSFSTKKLHSCILTQLHDGNHLEICHHGFSHFAQKNFTHSFSLNLMMAAILNFAIMDLAILHKKTSLMHSHSTWWWQSSWILLSWIQPSCTKKFTRSFWLNLMIAAILNSAMLDSRWLISSSWVRMHEFESDWTSLSQSFMQNGRIQDGRIQDGCHH